MDNYDWYAMGIEVIEHSDRTGGYTLWFKPQAKHKTGYVVGNGNKGIKVESIKDMEASYLASVMRYWYDQGYEGIDTWKHGSQWYIDPCRHYSTSYTAVWVGRTLGEHSIYDIGSQKAFVL